MSKKSIVGDSQTAAASYFKKDEKALQLDPAPAAQNVKNESATIVDKKFNAATNVSESSTDSFEVTQSKYPQTISINFNKKKKRDKAISVRVNSYEYAEFTKIVTELEYSPNDVINQLIIKFTEAHKK